MTRLGRIDKIQISGFKSIERLSLQLKDLNILIGANGAGKSNFISVFRLLRELQRKNLQFYVSQKRGADKLLFFGRKRTDALDIYLDFKLNAYQVRLAPDESGEALLFQQEVCQFFEPSIDYKGGTKTRRLARAGARESGLPDQPHTSSPSGHVAGYLSSWKVYHFHDTSESARIKARGAIYETGALLPNGENLAAFLRSIRETSEYKLIVRTIQRIAPFFLDFVLEREPSAVTDIRLRWRHRGSEETFDASDLSDGTLRFVCLTTLLLQPEHKLPTAILLDEPELGLHPYALQILAGMMRIASEKTQIIASTQSVTLANQFSWEDLIVVDREADASRFRRLKAADVEQWLDEYALGELWEKNLLGGTP